MRLVYWKTETSGGEFRLDAADQRLIGALPGFENVVKLVQYYVEENNRTNCKNKLERKGLKTSNRQVRTNKQQLQNEDNKNLDENINN